jgi:ubiquinone/menaquinone biosynthesis C-methylase UbiE
MDYNIQFHAAYFLVFCSERQRVLESGIMDTNENLKTVPHYDFYDYSTFWSGRNYEDASDKIAVTALLKKTVSRNSIVDVGAGLGRLVPCYAHLFRQVTLVDPSSIQLKRTETEIGQTYPNVSFLQGTAEHLPLADESVDAIVCVRVSHHIPDIAVPVAEYRRVLAPGGYLIFEIANKINVKSRVRAFLKMKSKELNDQDPVSVKDKAPESSIAFVNHNPNTIAKILKKEGFEIVSIRSVSNFRWTLFKKIFPISWLLFFERMAQTLLAPAWFGPSIYFLARKKPLK